MRALRPRHPDCTKRRSAFARAARELLAGGKGLQPCVRPALTLVELLLTIAVLGILAAILIPQLSGDLPERLQAGAQVLSSDIDYARSLAVANNSTYRLTFDTNANSYYLQHTGPNLQFNTLPRTPFRQSDDPADRQTTKLSMLPLPEPGVRLVAVMQMQGAGQAATSLEFTALGGTTCSYPTIVWLSAGSGAIARFVSVQVDPVTGLVTVGPIQSALPTAVSSVVQGGI